MISAGTSTPPASGGRLAVICLMAATLCSCRPSPLPPGSISIRYEPDAADATCRGGEFFVDGVLQGDYPVENHPLATGRHVIEIRSRNDCAGQGRVNLLVEPGSSHVLQAGQFH